jgi:hypothetical protein
LSLLWEKLASSPKAAASSFNVSNVIGAESTKLAIARLTAAAVLASLVAAALALAAEADALACGG